MLVGLDHREQSAVVLRADFGFDFRSGSLVDNTGNDERMITRKHER